MSADELRDWVRQNMTIDEERVLDDHKDLVSRFLGLAPDGRVFVRLDKRKLTTTEQVALYLVGKVYSNVAGYSESVEASNEELGRELGMPGGTVRRATMELRQAGWIVTAERGSQRVILNALAAILEQIASKTGMSRNG
jgi:DNA-binding transcriptional ArsR family regulator